MNSREPCCRRAVGAPAAAALQDQNWEERGQEGVCGSSKPDEAEETGDGRDG